MQTYNVAYHFENKEPLVKEIYDGLLTSLREFGVVTESAKKTSIHLERKTSFGGVHPRKNYLNLVIRADYEIKSARISKSEQVSKHRFHHTIKLEKVEDVDEELLDWLKDAYE